ncbi:DUF4307 domain-containing protein [Pseudoclavibacter soli]|uniref:DUF4307 domain-containing protein n=1 Tax=Pseudoclavibacter soli TaxID=452623 RepID=UPI00040EC22C|nr:DUF4307 domain-containing protein [Pseudoclavibacter soli]
MSNSDPQRAELLAERYGTPRRHLSRRAWLWLGTALVVVSSVAVALFTLVMPSTNIKYQTATSEVTADGDVVVGISISTTGGQAARCLVDARGDDQDQVGWRYVDIPASDQASRVVEVTVRSYRPALAGSVQNCWTI